MDRTERELQGIVGEIHRLAVPSFDPEPIGEMPRFFGATKRDRAEITVRAVEHLFRWKDKEHKEFRESICGQVYWLSCSLAEATARLHEIERLLRSAESAQQAVEGTI